MHAGRRLLSSLLPSKALEGVAAQRPRSRKAIPPAGQPTGPVLCGGWLTTIELPRG